MGQKIYLDYVINVCLQVNKRQEDHMLHTKHTVESTNQKYLKKCQPIIIGQ